MTSYAVIGGGIVGLATARAIAEREPDATITVVEKEPSWAAHQTGRNSGVIHSGIYYRPGTMRARLCVDGAQEMVRFAREHGVPVEVTGKLIVATDRAELDRLHQLAERAVHNGVPARLVGPAEVAEWEPYVRCVEAIRVETTGIVDYRAVTQVLAEELAEAGATLRLGEAMLAARRTSSAWRIQTERTELTADVLVNCAGLYSDRVARLAGVEPPVRIVPFRGEYFELVPERRHLVRGLIYPVPDPELPFLGVHFTRGVDGSVHAGPNAVFALAREGYRWRDVDLRDLREAVGTRSFWRLAKQHGRNGVSEMHRSLWRPAFVRSLQRLVPDVQAADLVRAPAGVRAQAVEADGSLCDDFRVVEAEGAVHVLNAPSPAATASLAIGRAVAARAVGSHA